jgi:putative FmdB family regulatory protein
LRAVPTYDYQCRSCGTVTEIIHSMLEDGPTTCERCGGALRRVLYPTGIIFKGSGFYSTDSRSARASATKDDSSSKGEASSTGEASPKTPAASSDSSDGGGSSGGSKKTDAPAPPPKTTPATETG